MTAVLFIPVLDPLWVWGDFVPSIERETTPTIHYMPCPNHEAAIEVEGYCPCFDGLEIDWTKTTGESFE